MHLRVNDAVHFAPVTVNFIFCDSAFKTASTTPWKYTFSYTADGATSTKAALSTVFKLLGLSTSKCELAAPYVDWGTKNPARSGSPSEGYSWQWNNRIELISTVSFQANAFFRVSLAVEAGYTDIVDLRIVDLLGSMPVQLTFEVKPKPLPPPPPPTAPEPVTPEVEEEEYYYEEEELSPEEAAEPDEEDQADEPATSNSGSTSSSPSSGTPTPGSDSTGSSEEDTVDEDTPAEDG